MAQPAGFLSQDNRTDMGIPVFWTTANSDPPWNFKIWLDQFLLAVTVKESVNPELLLEEPKEVLLEPLPRSETPREHENAQAITEREARDQLARDKILLENEERKTRGPKVGHNVSYNEVQKRVASRLFLALGTEGKKKFVQKNPHVEVSKLELRQMVALAKTSFDKSQSVTYERYKLFNRSQEIGESLEAFHAALTAQAARAELGTLEDELVRDLFISKMKNVVLQDTLTFETFSPEEVLKRALKFEQSKQTTQTFQKTNETTASTAQVNGTMKIKQEPIMSIGNKNAYGRRQPNNMYKKKSSDRKKGKNFPDTKTCTRCGRPFGEGHLKKFPAMGKTCKNCSKPNHFAKMCKSQQVNEIAKKSSSSDEECNLIQSFDSCEEFEIMAIESELSSMEEIDEYIKQQSNRNRDIKKSSKDIQKVDIRRNTRSKQIRSLKALVRIDHQIINMTIDTDSPVSFLNWATAKQNRESSKNTRFIPRKNLNLTTKFVDYNKQPINILGAITTTIPSAGWEVVGASFLITERRTRCFLGLDLQSKIGIHTTQKLAPKEKTRFDVLLCEQSEGWKNKFYSKFKNLFDRQGCSKNHVDSTKFKYPLCPLQEKGRRIPIHIQGKMYEETEKLLTEGHLKRLDKCTSDCFIAPIVITVKKDDSIKLALDAKPINRQLFKINIKCRMWMNYWMGSVKKSQQMKAVHCISQY